MRTPCFFFSFLLQIGLSCAPHSLESQENYVDVVYRSSVNLVDESRIIKGRILQNGEFYRDISCNSIVTNLIPVFIGDLWYQKVLFLHSCCQRGNQYGFNADVIAFYDEDIRCICVLYNIQAPAIIPERARYARIQYKDDDYNLYAATTNRSLLNLYSAFDKRLLVPDTNENYLTVHNSESSISHVLEIGYDYIDRGLGYGCLHTAFNSECIKTEGYNDYYEGEKWQIDCSSFVQLALTGIQYGNSRYCRGTSSENIADENSFSFDQFTEYNYRMIQFPDECGADTGRLYANKIAKYFYDRGYLYEVEPNFSNVQIGDILFWGDGSITNDFFYGIGHVAICSDVWDKTKGRKGIRVLETATENELEYSNTIKYGARPVLPEIPSSEKPQDLVSNVSVEYSSFSIKEGETTIISTITLSEDLQLRELYTLSLDCDVPEGVIIMAKNKGSKLLLGSSDLDEIYSSNGSIVKHFGIREKMLGEYKNMIDICLYATKQCQGAFILRNASLKKGLYL